MILALFAKGKKTIACVMLAMIYFETIVPAYALGTSGPIIVRSNERIRINNERNKESKPLSAVAPSLTAKPAVTAAVKKTADLGGPTQPESQAFHSVNNDNMVDLFSGDFSYNIPLMDVGGYPITIGYNSGISMDQEASWVGLGWNINPGTVTRSMRGLPDDFNGKDTITKTSSIKENKTVGVTTGADIEIVGLPLDKAGISTLDSATGGIKFGAGLSMGLFRNSYRGWGMENGINTSINVGKNSMGGFTGGLSVTNNSQEGLTLSNSFAVYTRSEDAKEHGGMTGSLSIGSSYNSRSGMKSVQVSGGIQVYKMVKDNAKNAPPDAKKTVGTNLPFGSYFSFAYPSYTPTISLPYTSTNITVTLKGGFETKVVHPSFFISGYISKQVIKEEDQTTYLPAYGYLNYQNGADNPGALLDFNREKEIPYRERPAVTHIAVPSYTYDAFAMSGEGTGGMFRAYRGDIGFVYDHQMRTKDGSQRYSVDIGAGDLVHGGVDLNFTRSYTQSGPWQGQNPLGKVIKFRNTDSIFEAAYFRNPGEMSGNSKSFYKAIGGDDVVAADIYQAGSGSSVISTTHNLNRYRNGRLEEKMPLPADSAIKRTRDKRTQVISYLTAKEAKEAGFQKYIESYKMNDFAVRQCDEPVPDTETPGALQAEFFFGGKETQFNNRAWPPFPDPLLFYTRNHKDYNVNIHRPAGGATLDRYFSARWQGRIKAPATGPYMFKTEHDDGVRLYLNDREMYNDWKVQGWYEDAKRTAYVNLVAGQMYDIRLEYFQGKGDYFMQQFWGVPGVPYGVLYGNHTYLPPSKDTFVNGNVSREERINSFRKENHISEIDVLNADGRRYIYGIPIYNLKQEEATFAVDPARGDAKEGLVKYNPNVDDSPANPNGNDHYFNSEKMPAYAHSFLLTGILSPDYSDLTGNGITPDDPGDAIKFNYSKIAGIRNPYKWRAPYNDSATYNQGLRTDNRDDKGSYVYGEKELWYLHSVESKNMIATFKVGRRHDQWAIDKAGKKAIAIDTVAKRLEEINLYTKADFIKYGPAATPVKTVHFEYSYELCAGMSPAPYADSGKLTLKRIWFSYNGNDKGKRNPYIFRYNKKNPRYSAKAYDRWGNYKDPLQNPGSTTANLITNSDYPYALQDSTLAAENAAAWTLDTIILPSGGRMVMTYESDDYAYVQNRRAMQFFSVAGFSSKRPEKLEDLSNQLYGDKEDNLYVAINVPVPVNSNADLAAKYFANLEKISFRLFVQMPSDRWGSGSEYVPCYAKIDPAQEFGYINSNTIWIKLKGIDAGGNDGSYSPLAKAAIQFLRLNLPSKAMPGSDVGDDLDLDVAVKILMSMGDNIKNAITSFDKSARAKGWAKVVDPSRTLVRLNSPLMKKYGGGLRVKRVMIYDHWNAMTQQKESVYGQEYQYTTTGYMLGKPVEVSSGVATYEPMLGGEENPWRMPIEYKEQVAPLAPVTLGYTEEPLGESLFPAPSVGYSKVRIRSIHAKNVRSASGFTETCFYTSYDFPTMTDMTTLSDSKKRYRPALANLLRINAKHYMAISQGFKVELNDMNGKVKSQAAYAETNSQTPVSYTMNYYKVDNQDVQFKHLNNTVKTIDSRGTIDPSASIGKDIELMADMREQRSITNANNFNINGDFFSFGLPPVWLIPSLLNLAQREDNLFRSAAITKVISRHGILDSVVVIEKGSKVVSRNLLYDSETGEPVLTSTKNEFDDPIYSFNYPAAWAYDGMSGAYKNIDVTISGIKMRNGKIIEGLSAKDANRYFTGGDELLIWSSQKTGGLDDCNPDIATWPNSGKIWAVDGNVFAGGSPEIYFVDKDGVPFSGNDMTMKVIRSGRKNISAVAGAVNMLENPLTYTVAQNGDTLWSLQIGTTSRVIDASVTEFQQLWKVADKRTRVYSTNCVPISYQQYMSDGECPSVPFANEEKRQTFFKNDCTEGGVPDSFTYIVPEGSYTSDTSQAKADSMALADILLNGQTRANEYLTCTYTNKEIRKEFSKNDCPVDSLSSDCGVSGAISVITYTVPAGKYTSTKSQGDADTLALEEINDLGQDYANSVGICTYYNMETSRAFTRNDCAGGTSVIYVVPEGTYSSTISPEVADSLAEADIQRNGQAYANTHGGCANTTYVKMRFTSRSTSNGVTTENMIFEFYADESCTIQKSVTNLVVNYSIKRTNCFTPSNTSTSSQAATCNGTSYTDSVVTSDDQGDGKHCWVYDYALQPGTGYVVK